jgi:glycosyltransferase involved in cell wall biosynthesis
MRVAVVNLTAGGMSGGYPKYLANIIPRLSRHPDIEAVLCATPASINLDIKSEDPAKVEFIACRPWRLSRIDAELETRIRAFRPDVVYVPVERPFSFEKKPVVIMLQNMEPFICPTRGNPPLQKIKGMLRLRYARKAVARADRIIALSNFVRKHLITRYDIPESRIGLVYHGVDMSRDAPSERPAAIPAGWEGSFIFTAGSIRPARGLEDLLGALENLRSRGAGVPPVVIAGEAEPAMERYRAKLVRRLEKQGLSSKVVWAGRLRAREMAWCYRNCLAFVMTSRVESFGQTAVEALSHGCACIAATNPCLPEIFRDAALYYLPGHAPALAGVVRFLVETATDRDRQTLAGKARRRAADFSWDICAERTVAELRKALEGSQPGRTT